MLNVSIDGIAVQVEPGTTILAAAQAAGVRIPTLCYLKGLGAIASCRVCVVDVEGLDHPVTACSTPVSEGMAVITNSERVLAYRRMALELIAADHGLDSTNFCFSCNKNGACELQDMCREYGVVEPQFEVAKKREPLMDNNPFLAYDANLCIRCQRCVGACNTLARNHTLQTGKRGARTTIEAPFGQDWRASTCESCGCCAQACPTGALTQKRRSEYRSWETNLVRTTCPHCGVGCQYDLVVKNGKIVDTAAADGPSNHGLMCVKGRSASFDFVDSPDRLRTPLIRNYETGQLEEASWDEALTLVCDRFSQLYDTHGGHSIAAFACSRSTNEDIYMFQKMARVALKTSNVDCCARVCHAPTVAGLATTLGSGAMTNSIEDVIDNAQVIMLVGSNAEEAHPVVGMQIRAAVERGARLIVVDPRDIGLAAKADIHLKLRPGTNVAFAHGIVHVLLRDGLADLDFIQARTQGFEELRELVRDYTPEYVAEVCGVDACDLVAAATMYGSANVAAIMYCLGVTEHSTGTDGVMGLSNMALVTGNLGRPGGGVNPLRGQNNVQGACDMGAQPDDFPGYQKVENPEVLAKFEQAYGVPLPATNGVKATECFERMISGEIKGLFLFGEDPVRTDADLNHVIRAIESLDFLVVDDLFVTETAKYADVVLPGQSYAEKEGTFTNAERRVQRVRKAVSIAGDTKPDTHIFAEVMNRMGFNQPLLTPAEIFDEVASLAPSYGGMSHARLDSEEVAGRGLQWPCLDANHPGTPIMHIEEFAKGLGIFSTQGYLPSTELPCEEYPFVLMTGRVLYHYNACAMTAQTEGINEISGASFIELNSQDAKGLGVVDGGRVRVSSRRGVIETTARVSEKTSPGETWMPFHFQDGNSNFLTIAALDRVAKTPEYKVCAIQVEAI